MPLAADRVPAANVDGELLPDWLTAADVPWLRELLLAAHALDGRTLGELRRSVFAGEPPPRAGTRWRPALATLQQLLLAGQKERNTTLRAAVFAAAAAGASRAEALAVGATAANLPVDAVAAALFADIGDQRTVRWPAHLDPDTLRRATNGHFARALLTTANVAELTLQGASRSVLRTAWLHGAWFRYLGGDARGARLRWLPPPGEASSGRRLAALVPTLAWTRQFVLRASCRWRGRRIPFVLSSLDALPVGAPPAAFDSRSERELAAALVRALPGWELLREPAPLPLGDHLAFPDFALRQRGGADPPWWLEYAGLRDASALAGKLELLAREARYLLCLPARWSVLVPETSRIILVQAGRFADAAEHVRRVLVAGA
jgi:hypothetical protein